MDAVTAFKTGLVELNVNQTQLARYVGVEPSRVSRGLTMELPFTVAETREISETIDAMRSIQAEMSLPIDWSLIGKVKPHVDARRK